MSISTATEVSLKHILEHPGDFSGWLCLPPMPWTSFRNASDEDLKSIYAYLRSLRPVVNHVPDVQPAAAVNIAE